MSATEWCSTIVPLDNDGDEDDDINGHNDDECKGTWATEQSGAPQSFFSMMMVMVMMIVMKMALMMVTMMMKMMIVKKRQQRTMLSGAP